MVESILRKEILELREKLQDKENELLKLKYAELGNIFIENPECNKLTNAELARFSRQIIVPGIGVQGQIALKKASVLIVGAGGLGCPSALYLVGAGVGHIGIVDYDEVELNNLHRQLLHTESSTGQSKVHSAAESLRRLNSQVQVIPYHIQLDRHNALEMVKQYSVVLDATDNVATRYLLNDACVMTGRPLVSGSALQLEGQLTVYNYNKGPCYRCLFPVPPPPETVTNCGDGGVLGAVPGVIGVLQALETMKIMLGLPGILSGRLLVFDGADSSFRNIYLRGRNLLCVVCGDFPSVTSLIDYEQFCGAKANDKDKRLVLLNDVDRITATEYNTVSSSRIPHVLVDVRSSTEFEICHLPEAWNLPLKDLGKHEVVQKLREVVSKKKSSGSEVTQFPVFVVCRRGNDSQKGVIVLRKTLKGLGASIRDIKGGLHSWAQDVDSTFPVY